MAPSTDGLPTGPSGERTAVVPQVAPPGRMRVVLPWVGFGLVAVVVVASTTAWASALRAPGRAGAIAAPPLPLVAASSVPPTSRTAVVTTMAAPSRTRTTTAVRPSPSATPVRAAAPRSTSPTSAVTRTTTADVVADDGEDPASAPATTTRRKGTRH